MTLHMDGARIANAAAALGVPLREFTTDAGVDILSFGGTKNGILYGEAIVVIAPADPGQPRLRGPAPRGGGPHPRPGSVLRLGPGGGRGPVDDLLRHHRERRR